MTWRKLRLMVVFAVVANAMAIAVQIGNDMWYISPASLAAIVMLAFVLWWTRPSARAKRGLGPVFRSEDY